jgi:type I restriction enzyme, S subunit
MAMNNETMMLLDRHFDAAFAAPDGIKKLRELILTLAMQGKLVPQDPNDEPASELLKAIEIEKKRLVKEGQIKAFKLFSDVNLELIPYEIPKGWEWVRLGNVGAFERGRSKHRPRNDNRLFIDGSYPFVQTGDVSKSKSTNNEITACGSYYNDFGLQQSRLWPKGTLCITIAANIAETGFLGMEACIPDSVVVFLSIGESLSKIVKVFIDVAKQDLERYAPSTAQKNINLGIINDLIFPLPPLQEQHRIVAEIDRLMARCDELEKLRADRSQKLLTVHTAALDALLKAKESSDFSTAWHFITQNFSELYSVKENVAELRKTILQLAVMGKLVPQDPNDEPASELLKAINLEKQQLIKDGKIKQSKPLPKIRLNDTPYKLPKGWEWAKLQDLLALVTDGDHMAPPKADNGTPFLVIGNLNKGKVTIENCRFVPHNYYKSLDWGKKPATNDILYTVTGSYGIPIFIDSDLEFCVQRHVAIFKSAKSSPVKYLMHLLKSRYAFQYATSIATGIAQKTVPLTGLRQMLIAVPPIEEQYRIVAEIDRLMALCDRLEESLEAVKGKQTDLLDALMSRI